jgi:hypothetical protein
MNAHIAVPRHAGRWPATVAVAVLVAGIAAAVVMFAVAGGSSVPARPSVPASHGAQRGHAVDPIVSLTPARLAAGALGTGYALPSPSSAPTMSSVLASMSPETRVYTKAIMSLTFAQLAAGAGGQP